MICGLVSSFALVLSGCGGSDLGSVSGTVTLDGNPLAGAQVMFMPVGGGGVSTGETDSAGKYTLICADGSQGAVIGAHTVSIELIEEEDTGDGTGEDESEASGEGLVPARYNEETELKADVQAGSNTFNFDLETGASSTESAEE